MSDISTQFIKQFFERLGEKTPKFFHILTLAFASAGTLLGTATYYKDQLISQHQAIPEWLTYVIFGLKGLLYISGIVTAQATIQTPSTPKLESEIKKPTLEDAMKEIAELKAKLPTVEAKTDPV